jgi:putative membrane-bound dehydrogenase-like protein
MRKPIIRFLASFFAIFFLASSLWSSDGNRLVYLEENNPYYVSRMFPKLATPMWVGEDGVQAVVVLAIDDMRDPDKYEGFLRPILDRLTRIDGAALSIMTNQVSPAHPRLQAWLQEGLSLEVHTIDHPCPCLAKGDFAKARLTYEQCVDLMNQVPSNRPVAFRMPCCDSLNTVSPRFFAEIFNRTTKPGHFLSIDSSVFNLLSANDPELPRELVTGPEGSDRFRRYLPPDRSFVNTIENYPYPYVINRLCWELPCAVPSDWEAQHVQRPNNPQTVEDWKAVLDATVIKQGVMCLVFHPHNWIKNTQVVELIDHAVNKHGKKVKFLNFKEVQQRLDKNLLDGQSLRDARGQDNGVRLLDLNNDGFIDVVIGNDKVQQTRIWSPKEQKWVVTSFPTKIVSQGKETGVKFAAKLGENVLGPGQGPILASMFLHNEKEEGVWNFDGRQWHLDKRMMRGIPHDLRTSINGTDQGVRLRDLDHDGTCKIIAGHPDWRDIFFWSNVNRRWEIWGALPGVNAIVDEQGRDQGLRFVDLNGDGLDDILISNERTSEVYLQTSKPLERWQQVFSVGPRGLPNQMPPITLQGSDRGAWFHSRHLWVQNEDTSHLKDHVDRRSFNEMLAQVEPEAKSPSESLASIQMRPGFVVELMAAEPLVQDPIAMAFGPDGKLWVVEMGDYPLGTDGKGKAGGRVLCLEDTKGSGKYDKSTVFLDGLPFPTGVLPWKKGVLVTCAPEIFYAEDTDGDGKADRRETLYRGFAEGNQQHRVNGLWMGLDNWLYGANGDSGGKIRSLKTGQEVSISGRDFRIRPDTGDIEAQTGQTQYGRCFDDWGNPFGCNNSNPMYHFVLDDHYLRRNPHLAAPVTRRDVSTPPGTAPVFPVSRTLPRFNNPDQANHFTSACGVTIYRDDLFGPAFAGNMFVSEPVHNLVHREVMSPQGESFTARRSVDEQRSEFLASTDNWFRPTMLTTGPDGALWVADMYRAVIEHPEWIPPEWQRRLDLRAGHDKGRIYRVYPVGTEPRQIPRLDKMSNQELVAALDSPNGWQRDMAQRLLIDRNAVDAVAELEKTVQTSARPQTRLHALCTLDGLKSLTAPLLKKALVDQHPGVRRHAVRLCEMPLQVDQSIETALVKMVDDPDPQVRLQLAYSLAYSTTAESAAALARLAQREDAQPYLMTAVMSSLTEKNYGKVVTALLVGPSNRMDLTPLLQLFPVWGTPKMLNEFAQSILAQSSQSKVRSYSSLAGLLDAIDHAEPSSASRAPGNDIAKVMNNLQPVFSSARDSLKNEAANLSERIAAARLLGRQVSAAKQNVPLLVDHLHPTSPDELQLAIVEAIIRTQTGSSFESIFARWASLSPKIRTAAVDALLPSKMGLQALLGAMESKTVQISVLTSAQRMRLLQTRDTALAGRAMALFGSAIKTDRQQVIDRYRSVLTMPGNAVHGAQLFAKHCATCHRLNQVGHQVGPDLASLGDKSPAFLLISILDPNRAVEARYLNYVAVTKTGRTVTGILGQETSTSITLIGPDSKTETLLRVDLEELTTTGKSAMPEGLENDLPIQDFADVIAHVRGLSPQEKRKSFTGNQPERVRPAADGSLTLTAAKAEIYGPTLIFEEKYGNIGFWQSPEDYAAWEIEVSQPGRYTVQLDWACPRDGSGNIVKIQAGLEQLVGRIASTGSWDRYKQEPIGELALNGGVQRIVVRSDGRIVNWLMDLRGVKLVRASKQ